MINGQCLCGAVTFKVDMPDDHMGETRYCYCSNCRRANGTAFSANVPVPVENYTLLTGTDAITEFESSPGTQRAFCSKCGSPVYGKKVDDPGHIRIRLGTLDQDAKATPVAHAWTSEKPAWHNIDGYLKRFKESADGTGGTPK
ncbi:MAG: GFA family protein [Rhodospirillaceae bacterium]|nr:GFA family protein [Rhodospirillaceae bacterium]MBT5238971.1 GFA family protein [Rhodospirillaceae bacterium]MBT5565187.1 GFA family protein [Rhodospirillaceae bacterium]MBT7450413.1 GFA family protein [Rhodospirillaceae bacterium]